MTGYVHAVRLIDPTQLFHVELRMAHSIPLDVARYKHQGNLARWWNRRADQRIVDEVLFWSGEVKRLEAEHARGRSGAHLGSAIGSLS